MVEKDPRREELRRRGKAITDLLLDDPDQPSYTAYEKITLNLGIARTNFEIIRDGDMILVQDIDGAVDMRLHNLRADTIDISRIRNFIYTPYERFFITNTSQPGREAVLLIGKTNKFMPGLGLSHLYHDARDAVLFTDESLNIGDIITHYNIETTGFNTLMILASSTAQTTWYPQFSHDETNWYDYCDSAGTPIQYAVTNAKKAIAINDAQAKWFRVVVYANAAAVVNGDLSVQA